MSDDPYLWLEDVDGEEALAWVRAQNVDKSAQLAAGPEFAETKERIRAILDSDDKIPAVVRRGAYLYNFWKDAEHERGLWRRTTPESYRTDDPEWETLLDLDALSAAEGENWVWHGASVWRGEPGSDDAYRWALIDLSRGGSDADVTREFDLATKSFVEGGFFRPEAKGSLGWETPDSVLVSTDFGPGTMGPSGYPLVVKRWRRGTPLEDAETLFEGEPTDMGAFAGHDATPGFERTLVRRLKTFRTDELFIVGDDDALIRVPIPESAIPQLHREWLALELREDWAPADVTYPAGALIAARLDDVLAGGTDYHVLYEPTPTSSLADAAWTRDHLVLTILDDVVNRLEILTPGADGFRRTPVADLPTAGTLAVAPVDAIDGNELWLSSSDFLTPTTLALTSIADDGTLGEIEPVKALPAFFDAEGLVVEQHFAESADGTRVPYFLVRRGDLALDGTTPTLLYAYGGFEISLIPAYAPALGAAWLSKGGAYALANIRGGGEYGPRWHQAALKEHRHRAYEDMAAVAGDLVERGVTSPAHLGVQGGSNGGLLAGNMLTQYPALFGAVVIQVPLLDMRRYAQLLAGHSWIDEYGDPDDPAQWELIKTFSPYHLFDAGADYPPVLFTTSTRDDRVHPGHARKLAAKMLAAGKDVTYYENIEGGHGGAATNEQLAHMQALAYTFLRARLA